MNSQILDISSPVFTAILMTVLVLYNVQLLYQLRLLLLPWRSEVVIFNMCVSGLVLCFGFFFKLSDSCTAHSTYLNISMCF